jgi:hypothetical protein
LWLGIGLIGVWIAATELALVFNRAIEVFWYSGGERRLEMGDRRVEAVLSGLKSLVFVAIGGALFLRAAQRLGLGPGLRSSGTAPETEAAPPESTDTAEATGGEP